MHRAQTCSHPLLPLLSLVLLVALTFPGGVLKPTLSEGQEDSQSKSVQLTPSQFGFAPFSIESGVGTVNFFVSTAGRPLATEEKRPLFLYLQGSGPSAIFYGDLNRLGSSVIYDARELPDHHFVVISKPGLDFHEVEKEVASDEYDEKLSLPYRVAAARAVLDYCAKQSWCDPTQIVVVGHSEGADVAPWLGLDDEAGNPSPATHVAVLAPGGVSQMFDFALMFRKEAMRGEITNEEADQKISELYEAFTEIFADPTSTEKTWGGATYLKWSTFFRPAMEAYRVLERPLFIAAGRNDTNTPVECAEAIRLEMIRLGKKNVTYKLWPTDHYFIEVTENDAIDRRLDVLADLLAWLRASASK